MSQLYEEELLDDNALDAAAGGYQTTSERGNHKLIMDHVHESCGLYDPDSKYIGCDPACIFCKHEGWAVNTSEHYCTIQYE